MATISALAGPGYYRCAGRTQFWRAGRRTVTRKFATLLYRWQSLPRALVIAMMNGHAVVRLGDEAAADHPLTPALIPDHEVALTDAPPVPLEGAVEMSSSDRHQRVRPWCDVAKAEPARLIGA